MGPTTKADFHPDAHATRIKISLVTLGAQDVMECPWNLATEYEHYVVKQRRVSASCRLTLWDELAVTDAIARKGQRVGYLTGNRVSLLRAMAAMEAKAGPRNAHSNRDSRTFLPFCLQ